MQIPVKMYNNTSKWQDNKQQDETLNTFFLKGEIFHVELQ